MLKKIKYITPENLIDIVDIIENLQYENQEQVPKYDREKDGIDNYFALIDRSKQPYYPSFYGKAAFLFININNHYFSNGNKRLATTTTVFFLEKNGYTSIDKDKDYFTETINALFPTHKIINFSVFSPIDLALYNLAIIVAKKNENSSEKITHDELKKKIEKFFTENFQKIK